MKIETRGRKPIDDKKKTLTVYIRESIINGNGGLERCKFLCEEYLSYRTERKVVKNEVNTTV
jgi:hypothetical protein